MNIEIKVFLVSIFVFPILTVIFWRRESVLVVSGYSAGTGMAFCYIAILVTVFAVNHRLNSELQAFDLNGDGFFSGKELTPEQNLAMKRVTNDTGRNFAFITGIFYSFVYSVLVFVFAALVTFIQNKLLHWTRKSTRK